MATQVEGEIVEQYATRLQDVLWIAEERTLQSGQYLLGKVILVGKAQPIVGTFDQRGARFGAASDQQLQIGV